MRACILLGLAWVAASSLAPSSHLSEPAREGSTDISVFLTQPAP